MAIVVAPKPSPTVFSGWKKENTKLAFDEKKERLSSLAQAAARGGTNKNEMNELTALESELKCCINEGRGMMEEDISNESSADALMNDEGGHLKRGSDSDTLASEFTAKKKKRQTSVVPTGLRHCSSAIEFLTLQHSLNKSVAEWVCHFALELADHTACFDTASKALS